MKHVVIVAHPSEQSFTMAMAKAYAEAVRAQGHDVVLRDLYRMNFDPCLHADEFPWSRPHEIHDDVKLERQLLADASVFALVYPFWFNAPPAILKGYVDRIFGSGFGFKPSSSGAAPLLAGRGLITISFSGAPNEWVQSSGALRGAKQYFDDHIAAVCGLKVIDHLHFGQIVPGMRPDVVTLCTSAVASAVARYFPARDESEPNSERVLH